jgi:hypothetical protein
LKPAVKSLTQVWMWVGGLLAAAAVAAATAAKAAAEQGG